MMGCGVIDGFDIWTLKMLAMSERGGIGWDDRDDRMGWEVCAMRIYWNGMDEYSHTRVDGLCVDK